MLQDIQLDAMVSMHVQWRVIAIVMVAMPVVNAFLMGTPVKFPFPAVLKRSACGAPRAWRAMCLQDSEASCTAAQVLIEAANDRMYGCLARLRSEELSRNFAGMTQREAELLEMTKLSEGIVCLVATVPLESPCAASLSLPEAPGAANVREMIDLGWLTQGAAEERLREMQIGWEHELAAGAHRHVVGAVDVQELNDLGFFPLPLMGSSESDDAPLFYVCNMVVHETARRVGIGSMLLKAALAHAKACNASTVCLQVRRDNISAQRLYRKAGFTEADAQSSNNFLRLPPLSLSFIPSLVVHVITLQTEHLMTLSFAYGVSMDWQDAWAEPNLSTN